MLQEGFAVAYGGRGGKEPLVMLDVGYFLARSEMLDYRSMLRRSDFLQQDPSMTYPPSGLFNLFLVKEVGIENYLRLYRKYSTTEDRINNIMIDSADLPAAPRWSAFLDNYVQHRCIDLKASRPNDRPVLKSENAEIFELEDRYVIRLKDKMLLSLKSAPTGYRSKRFQELFPDKKYRGEKYAIAATPHEINIYNLYSNNLTASLVSTFCIPPADIRTSGGMFEFQLCKSVFDEPVRELILSQLP